MNNNNVGLLLVVLLIGVLSFVAFNSNISFKNVLKGIQRDEYKSPFGPQPSKAFEGQWEIERIR